MGSEVREASITLELVVLRQEVDHAAARSRALALAPKPAERGRRHEHRDQLSGDGADTDQEVDPLAQAHGQRLAADRLQGKGGSKRRASHQGCRGADVVEQVRRLTGESFVSAAATRSTLRQGGFRLEGLMARAGAMKDEQSKNAAMAISSRGGRGPEGAALAVFASLPKSDGWTPAS